MLPLPLNEGDATQGAATYLTNLKSSINQSIKTHFYSAICRNESEAHVATRTRLSVQIVRFLKYD